MTTTGAIPVWLGIMNGAVLPVDARNHVANLETGHVFVPKAPETLTYDADGNLLSDGRWTYTWDAENRVVKVESRSDTPQASWRRVEWTYDALGRRIRQTTRVWTNNTWAVVEDMKFVSDPTLFGRHIAELNATNNALMRSYVWGLDLSGAMDGAGGVGGLLWVTLHTASGPASGTHFTCYDGNGNVVSLVSATTGDVTARYEYGPFGEPIRVSGPAAALNPFRFSTKRTCNTTDLVLYEYRAYNPVLGRWLSRDPIDESGGLALCTFVHNDPEKYVDAYGLERMPFPPDILQRLFAWFLSKIVDWQFIKVTVTYQVACPPCSAPRLIYLSDIYTEERNELAARLGEWEVSFALMKPKKHVIIKKYRCCLKVRGSDTTPRIKKKIETWRTIVSEGFEFEGIGGEIAVKERIVEKEESRQCKVEVTPTASWRVVDWPDVVK